MKKKKRTFDIIKKCVIMLFCAVTVTMNVVNYIKNDASKDLGVLYEWSQEAQNAVLSEESGTNGKDIDIKPKAPEINDFSIVNLNTATVDELQTISGIGPAKAKAIIEYRDRFGNFVAVEEIMQVTGIGEGIFAKIKDFICVD